MTRLEEIHLIDEVNAALDRGGRFDGVVQGVDLSPAAERLAETDLGSATFIGCPMPPALLEHAVACGALVMPPMPGLPYRTGRRCVYTVEELYDGFDPDAPASYADTLDARVYRHWVDTGRVTGADVVETLARRLHDHGITDALDDLVAGRRVAAVMGGHGLSRTDPGFAAVARIARTLARDGVVIASGGGPGAMEAAHLGPWLAPHDDDALAEAVTLLAEAPYFEPAEPWLAAAFRVRDRWPSPAAVPMSIGIPTWLYGHEPPNAFASHVAKYFDNSVREAGLLTVATQGIVFTPGSAGTVQEIFQDATQNHYETVGPPSPMVFLGVEFWTNEIPVLDVLRSVGGTRRWLDLVTVTDDEDVAVAAILEHTR